MSYPSALMGQDPISETDALIRRGILIVAPSQLNPNKSEPFGPPRPVDYHFETNAPSLIGGEAVSIFFIALFTALRVYVRLFKKKNFGLDDYLIIPGALGAIIYLSLDIASHTKGCLGKHIYDCTYTEVYWFMRIADVEQPLFYFSVFCVKLSVAFANRRITGLASKRWMIVHWVFICLFLVLLPTTVFIQAFQCLPVPVRYSLIAIGSLTDPTQIKCLNMSAVSLATRVLHILTDVALLCVPITIMARLQMPWKKKARLISIFALGGMSTLASILRNIDIFHYNNDITWQYYGVYAWNTIDITFAVIVASLPALNSLLDVCIDGFKSLTSRNSSKPSLRLGAHGSEHSMERKLWNRKPSDGDSGVAVQAAPAPAPAAEQVSEHVPSPHGQEPVTYEQTSGAFVQAPTDQTQMPVYYVPATTDQGQAPVYYGQVQADYGQQPATQGQTPYAYAHAPSAYEYEASGSFHR
ncbi:uncharacterized protein F4822DRAFT_316870 [Hypoxylon trugodes]|uniref:uncharacterized protein n=1 Tax=Hypoxylon trugodes TaxID=326681 RepID=UPI00219072AC|nr:uncharacterized protein F4822DRAFT_316870 [Hypoxylon trugodes]KAI1386453.1 hypothetical protein F4822DRAFT_316870 [Hypoxylon trugodes]